MPTKVAADQVLEDSKGVEKVWESNPEMKLGKTGDTVTFANYQATIQAVGGFTKTIEDLRHDLDGLLVERDDAALKLSGY